MSAGRDPARSPATVPSAPTPMAGWDPEWATPLHQARRDPGTELRRTWGVLRRNAWILLGFLVVAIGMGLLLTRRAVPMYQASATLRITDEESGVPGLDVLRELGGAGNEVNTELEVLRSRTLAGEVVDEQHLRIDLTSPRKLHRSEAFLHLSIDPEAPRQRLTIRPEGSRFRITSNRGDSVDASAGDMAEIGGVTLALRNVAAGHGTIELEVMSRETAIDRLTDGALRISRPSRDANILVVRFRGRDPKVVEAIPNALIRAFVLRRVDTRRAGARSTVAFLREQIDTLQVELRSAEQTVERGRRTGKSAASGKRHQWGRRWALPA